MLRRFLLRTFLRTQPVFHLWAKPAYSSRWSETWWSWERRYNIARSYEVRRTWTQQIAAIGDHSSEFNNVFDYVAAHTIEMGIER